jgi:hypothetical protein
MPLGVSSTFVLGLRLHEMKRGASFLFQNSKINTNSVSFPLVSWARQMALHKGSEREELIRWLYQIKSLQCKMKQRTGSNKFDWISKIVRRSSLDNEINYINSGGKFHGFHWADWRLSIFWNKWPQGESNQVDPKSDGCNLTLEEWNIPFLNEFHKVTPRWRSARTRDRLCSFVRILIHPSLHFTHFNCARALEAPALGRMDTFLIPCSRNEATIATPHHYLAQRYFDEFSL